MLLLHGDRQLMTWIKARDYKRAAIVGSTTTYGTGQYKLTLPVAPVGTHRWHFDANGYDTSATAFLNLWAGGTGQTMDIFYLSSVTTAASTYVGQTAPMTWATGDILTINGVYESA